MTAWENEFSDISTGRVKAAKIRKLKKRAEELQWTQEELDHAIDRTTRPQNWNDIKDWSDIK